MNPVRFDAIRLIWRPAPHHSRRVVGTLTKVGDGFSFRYDHGPELDKAKEEGFRGYPGMPDFDKVYNGQAMGAFASRLPSRERPDLERLLAGWGAHPSQDDFELLGLTFGRLPTDMYEFIPEVEPMPGTRYYSDLAGLQSYTKSEAFRDLVEGAELELVPNPSDPFDCAAVKVLHLGHQVAHLKRIHADSVCRAIEAGLDVSARLVRARTNGVIQEVIVEIEYR